MYVCMYVCTCICVYTFTKISACLKLNCTVTCEFYPNIHKSVTYVYPIAGEFIQRENLTLHNSNLGSDRVFISNTTSL